MSNVLNKICELRDSISLAFTGEYQSNNPYIEELKADIKASLKNAIESPYNDKINRNNDLAKVSRDMNEALKKHSNYGKGK